MHRHLGRRHTACWCQRHLAILLLVIGGVYHILTNELSRISSERIVVPGRKAPAAVFGPILKVILQPSAVLQVSAMSSSDVTTILTQALQALYVYTL